MIASGSKLEARQETSAVRVSVTPSGIRKHLALVALVVVWLTFGWITGGIFFTPRNFSNLIRQTGITGILAVGMTMVILAGQIDLSVGSIVGLAGLVAVLAQISWHAGLLGSIVVGILVGIGIGALQGWLTAYGRIPAFIVTLGGLLVWRGLAKWLSAGNTYPVAVRSFKSIGQGYLGTELGILLVIVGAAISAALALRENKMRVARGQAPWSPLAFLLRILWPLVVLGALVAALNTYAGVPVPTLIFAIVGLVVAFVLDYTQFGKTLRTGGQVMGVTTVSAGRSSTVLWAFIAMGGLAALAGIVYAARYGSAGPEAGALLEIDAIAACVIGGVSLTGGEGTIMGACLGALLMASIDNGLSLRNATDSTFYIVKGVVLVAAVGLEMIGRRPNQSLLSKGAQVAAKIS